MKLRNKKTGQKGNFTINVDHFECINLDNVPEYNSLAELNEEWEDYEGSEYYWFISSGGEIKKDKECGSQFNRNCKEIGNYFETKEEAEQAVEKLKAWKRLKDKGFINKGVFSMNLNWCKPDDDDWKAYDLLFGGKE